MGVYDLFRKIAQSNLTSKEIAVNQIKYDISQDFKDSPSYEFVLIDNTAQDVQIVTDKTDNKKMLSMPDELFHVGQVVDWNDNKFLVTDIDEDQQIQTKGIITLCNNSLKFYNKTNVLYQIPCIIGKGTIGFNETKFITLAADENIVTCPNTTDSSNIDMNTRFILSGNAYKVQGIDNVTQIGLLNIKVKDDEITVNDNISLSIADYLQHQIIRSVLIKNGSSASLLYTNATLQLIIECKENNAIINNPVVTYLSNAPNVCTVSSTGLITAIATGNSIITVNFGTSNASITITSDITIVDNDSLTITPFDAIITINKSKIFTTHFWNNGVEVFNQGCVWGLTNSDGLMDVYATITPNGFDCTLTASNNVAYTGKYVKLRSTLVSDGTKFIEREIRLVSLI